MVSYLLIIVVLALQYVLVAIGFSLIYTTARFIHFAHAAIIAVGAFGTFFFATMAGWPVGVSLLGAVLVSAAVGMVIDMSVYRPLRRRNAGNLIFLIASLGLYIVLQNLISLAFGDGTRIVPRGFLSGSIALAGTRVTLVQLATITAGVLSWAGVYWMLRSSKLGLLMRATAEDADLARTIGMQPERLILAAFALGSGLAGLAGALIALDVGLSPTMGMTPFIMGAVVAIVSGIGSMTGMLVMAFVLAALQQSVTWFIGGQWQDTIALLLLLVFLLARPEGLFGRKLRLSRV